MPPDAVSPSAVPPVTENLNDQDAIVNIFGEPVPDENVYDILILSDSIYRHVRGECPKKKNDAPLVIRKSISLSGARIMKVVYPGARCQELIAEAASFAQEHRCNEVLVHVGSNYAYSGYSLEETADEISGLLNSLAAMMPYAKITFSQILPRIMGAGPEISATLHRIYQLNSMIRDACSFVGHGYIEHDEFRTFRGKFDRSLLARDGCHLSYSGVAAIENSINENLLIFHHPFIKY